MPRAVIGVLVMLATLAVAGCTAQQPTGERSSGQVQPSGQPSTQGTLSTPAQPSGTPSMAPYPAAADWVGEITNPWYPYVRGTTFVYRGSKDGKPTADTYVVTSKKKVIAGAPATVVLNTLTTGGKPIEVTEDWYAQDKQGNVWYLGEATKELDSHGKVTSTEGSWQAGVGGAVAGLYMPARPKPGDAFYQEYYKGHAEDTYRVVSINGTITVPFGSFTGLLVTSERTVLEPGVVTQKYYGFNVGQVAEKDVQGGTEYANLVSIKQK